MRLSAYEDQQQIVSKSHAASIFPIHSSGIGVSEKRREWGEEKSKNSPLAQNLRYRGREIGVLVRCFYEFDLK